MDLARNRRKAEHVDKIRQALRDKKLVIIVGAGISLSATHPSPPRITWTGLIRDGLDYLEDEGFVAASNEDLNYYRGVLQRRNANSRTVLRACGYLKDELDHNKQFPTWLQSVFGSLHRDVAHPEVFEALRGFHRRGARLMTTNYDELLEHYCDLQRVRPSIPEDVRKYEQGTLNGVFHIHGSFQDPKDVVLDPISYYQVKTSDDVQTLLKTYLGHNTILFVGCGSGLEDPNFSALLGWASSREENIPNYHYLFIRDRDNLSYSPLITLKYGQNYEDLIPYLNGLLDDPAHPLAGVGVAAARAAAAGVLASEDALKLLPYAAKAPFNSYETQHHPTCHPGTTIFLNDSFSNIARERSLDPGWPGKQVIRRLVPSYVEDCSSEPAEESYYKSPQFRAVVRDLCQKEPEAARLLAATILEYIGGPQPESQNNTVQITKRKSTPRKDLSYRPSQPAKVKAEKIYSLDKSSQPEGSTAIDGNFELHEVKSGDDVDASEEDVAQDDPVREREKKADNRDSGEATMNKEIEKAIRETRSGSVSTEAGQWRPASSESAAQTTSLPPAIPITDPATPTKREVDDLFSPQTEDIHREKIPRSLESIRSSLSPPMSSPPIEATSLKYMILEAVQVIHGFSKYQHGVPSEVHSRILKTLRGDHKEILSMPNLNEWSDGSMWMQVLEAGKSENQRVTILNMLEYMGAWEWYDGQIELLRATVRTKRNKQVSRRAAAIDVLNRMQDLQTRPQQPGKSKGVRKLTLVEEGDGSGILLESNDASIANSVRLVQRKRISMQLSRGNKLCTKLVKELGLGILFSPKIWVYTKKRRDQLDIMIKDIQADSKRIRFLQILGEQLERLINEGQPDLHSLFTSLEAGALVSEKEYRELKATFVLEAESMPNGSLNIAVDQLIEDVSVKVLGKHKLEDDDSVTQRSALPKRARVRPKSLPVWRKTRLAR